MSRHMCLGIPPEDSGKSSLAFLISVLKGKDCIDVINNNVDAIKAKYNIEGIKAYSHVDFSGSPYGKKIEREMYDELRSETDLRTWGLIEKNNGNTDTSSIVIAVKGKKSEVDSAVETIATKLPLLESGAYIKKTYILKSPSAQ